MTKAIRRITTLKIVLLLFIGLTGLSPLIASASIPDQTLTVGEGNVSVDVGPHFSDHGGGRLTYTIQSADSGVATASMSGTTVTITPVAAGSTTVTVAGTSRGNVTVEQTIAVIVIPRLTAGEGAVNLNIGPLLRRRL